MTTYMALCLILIMAMSLALWPQKGHTAGFDCAKASTAVEKMICADAELSKLDDEMNEAFQNHISNNEKYRDKERTEQQNWLHGRNECLDTSCLIQAYQNRLKVLKNTSERKEARLRLSEESPGPIIYYTDLRRSDVQWEDMEARFWRLGARPQGFFQLAGSNNDQLCMEALEAFNEPGKYVGDDIDRWLTENSKKVQFHLLADPKRLWTRELPPEYAVADIDGDGRQEYIYKKVSCLMAQAERMMGLYVVMLNKTGGFLTMRFMRKKRRLNRRRKPVLKREKVIHYFLMRMNFAKII
jgi:Uncharacterized protein conserved in bacteria, putative lipoprotein